MLSTCTFITRNGGHEDAADGDRSLGDWISPIGNTPGHRSRDTTIFVISDEAGGSDSSHGESCADGRAGRRPSLSQPVGSAPDQSSTRPGKGWGAYFTHPSLLRTTENVLGLAVYLRHAAGPGAGEDP